MSAPFRKVLMTNAKGVVVPHTLADVGESLVRLDCEVHVQEIAHLQKFEEKVVAIIDGLVSVEPDLVMTIDMIALLPDYIAALARPPQVVSWFYDHPGQIADGFLSINSNYHVFCWDRAYLPLFLNKGLRHVRYQPFATNPRVYRPREKPDYEYDISFVGQWSPRRAAIIGELARRGCRIDVFGDEQWSKLQDANIVFHGHASNRVECPRIYNASRINLNISSEQLITSLPVRVFDVLGCAGFLLTDDREDASRLFRPDKELVIYRDIDELFSKIERYLHNASERDEIRACGHARVMAEYTFDKVLPEMLEQVRADSAEPVENTPMYREKLCGSLWLTAMSYMKFGKYQEAYDRLRDAMRFNPKDKNTLLGMAVLGNLVGQPGGVEACLPGLKDAGNGLMEQGLELLARTRAGEKVAWWDKLYGCAFPGLKVDSDGTIPGWKPVRRTIGGATLEN